MYYVSVIGSFVSAVMIMTTPAILIKTLTTNPRAKRLDLGGFDPRKLFIFNGGTLRSVRQLSGI